VLLYCFLYEASRAFADPPKHQHVASESDDNRCGLCYHRFGDGVKATRTRPWRYFSEIKGRAKAHAAAYRLTTP